MEAFLFLISLFVILDAISSTVKVTAPLILEKSWRMSVACLTRDWLVSSFSFRDFFNFSI